MKYFKKGIEKEKIICYNQFALGDGDVAQLARASGSYPEGRGFDPLRRYHKAICSIFSSFDKRLVLVLN